MKWEGVFGMDAKPLRPRCVGRRRTNLSERKCRHNHCQQRASSQQQNEVDEGDTARRQEDQGTTRGDRRANATGNTHGSQRTKRDGEREQRGNEELVDVQSTDMRYTKAIDDPQNSVDNCNVPSNRETRDRSGNVGLVAIQPHGDNRKHCGDDE